MNINELSPPITQQQTALYETLQNLTGSFNSGTFVFSSYTKYQLSYDGYVFWVNNGNKLTINGAIHIGVERQQDKDSTFAMNSVVLNTNELITAFNEVASNTMWVADITSPDNATVKVAFQRQMPFFENAGIYHYAGFAVFPYFYPQIIDSASDVPSDVVVSSSTPIWLNLPNALTNLPGIPNQITPVYASFLVPENISPPYIVAHVEPDLTEPVGAFPYIGGNVTGQNNPVSYSHLCRDKVELCFFGMTNQQILTYINALIFYSRYYDVFGFGSSPVVQDKKHTQAEIKAISMEKSYNFYANYYQQQANVASVNILTQASITVNI